MARPIRIEFPGALYHVTSRGNAKRRIFVEDRDYRSFFSILGEVADEYEWSCYAYCLMPNHYHLVFATPSGVLSKGMRQLNGVYAQRCNHRHGSSGHVFQGRFKSMLVDREPYLLEVCRYVVLNPVRAGLAKRCDGWRWSSYGPTAGLAPKPGFLDCDGLLMNFGRNLKRARKAFAEFVQGGKGVKSPWKKLKGGIFLGDERFVSGLSGALIAKKGHLEFPRYQRTADRPPLEHILTQTQNELLRNQQIIQARKCWEYDIREISEHLRLHRNTVAAILRKAEREEQ